MFDTAFCLIPGRRTATAAPITPHPPDKFITQTQASTKVSGVFVNSAYPGAGVGVAMTLNGSPGTTGMTKIVMVILLATPATAFLAFSM